MTGSPHWEGSSDRKPVLTQLRDACIASMIVTYAQGMSLIQPSIVGLRIRIGSGGSCSHLAWRLHHSRGAAGGHPRGLHGARRNCPIYCWMTRLARRPRSGQAAWRVGGHKRRSDRAFPCPAMCRLAGLL